MAAFAGRQPTPAVVDALEIVWGTCLEDLDGLCSGLDEDPEKLAALEEVLQLLLDLMQWGRDRESEPDPQIPLVFSPR